MSSSNDLDPERHDPNHADGHDSVDEQAKIVKQSLRLRAVVLRLREQLVTTTNL
jgi:hypothetical protein